MDYKNGRIYIIRNHVNEKVYVGATTQGLSKRFSRHKKTMRQKASSPLHKAMTEIGEDKFYIELIESYPCDNKEALNAREGYWIRYYDSYKNGYNGKIEGRNQQQYRQDNAEEIRQYRQKYKEDHAEEIKQCNQKYREDNAEKIKQCKQKYRQDHAEEIKQYNQQYNRKRVRCELCAVEVLQKCLSRHNKSIKHNSMSSEG
jgi:group I intron endonuclease